jgi:riboflavin synthase
MKLGFLDSIFNYADAYDSAAGALSDKIPNLQLERMTTPHLLKIPLCAKLLFGKGCDAVIVFLTALPEEFDEIRLIEEKIIDVELSERKFVFVVVVSDAEFSNEEKFRELTKERLSFIAEAIQKIVEAPSEMHAQIANADMASAMSMFSSEGTSAAAAGAEEGGGTDSGAGGESPDSLGIDEDGKSLF